MYVARGLITNKIYAKGTKADVFRQLQQKYPSTKTSPGKNNVDRTSIITRIYKEPLKIIKK